MIYSKGIKNALVVSALNSSNDKSKGTTSMLEDFSQQSKLIIDRIYNDYVYVYHKLRIPLSKKLVDTFNIIHRHSNLECTIAIGEKLSSILVRDFFIPW